MNRTILAASVALSILVGCSGATPTPTLPPCVAPTTAPTTTPTATAAPTAKPAAAIAPVPVQLNVPAGPEARRVVVDLPPAWHLAAPEPADTNSVVRGDTLPPTGMFILFATCATTYADPCGHVLRTP